LTNILRNNAALLMTALMTVAVMREPAASTTQLAKKGLSISPEARALVRQAIASTGLILVRNSTDAPTQAPRARGSAVIVRSDGIVVTNNHVITNDRTGRLYDEMFFGLSRDGDQSSASTRYKLKPLIINTENDLALLRIIADYSGNPVPKFFTFPSIEIGDSRKIKTLDDLFIVGFPEKGGLTVTISPGVVEGKDILGNWIKTDARVIHGNSGGAAVNSEGKLVGIPTKVVADEQPIDTDGDGFPDDYRRYGAVGFLRPSYLVVDMLAQVDTKDAPETNSAMPSTPKIVESSTLVAVQGVVKSSTTGRPIAGALVGLLPFGETTVSESTLLTWGSTNAEGEFKLNRPVPPAKYTIKAKAFAHEFFTANVELGPSSPPLVIEMRAASVR
jgi:S1-C subfamily serine protease